MIQPSDIQLWTPEMGAWIEECAKKDRKARLKRKIPVMSPLKKFALNIGERLRVWWHTNVTD